MSGAGLVDWLDDKKLCPRCSKDRLCCEMLWEHCETCGGDGYEYVDQDDEFDDGVCQVCDGEGGWFMCDCNDAGVHTCSLCKEEGHTSLICKHRPGGRQ